jgi:signal transduction histidine kinase/DNA-binding response OmpR family regulator
MSYFPALLTGALLVCCCAAGLIAARFARASRWQERELQRLAEELEQSRQENDSQARILSQRSDLDSLKDEFISTVSHELRTPLTSIRGALGLLSAGLLGNVDAKAQNLLRIASTNTERLIRLINDILDLERMESGRAPLTLRRCSLVDLARESIETMTAMAESAHIRLDLQCHAASELVYFDADADRIQQVLTNLLSNAIKFSPRGSSVCLQIEANSDSLLLKVIDQGRGIPSNKLETVFDRFQQVESGDSTRKGGTGLGLAICRSIVQQHNGAIWAQSNQGVPGTTLWVQFSRASRASDVPLPSSMAGSAQPGQGRILICDDDAGIRVVVAEQLRQHGYEIVEARSGQEAITLAQSAQEGPISAVLLDLEMPGFSGWETLQRLRAHPATRSIPVVILSVVAPTPSLLSGRRKGRGEAQGWVQKPFNENLLLSELGRVLNPRIGAGRILLVEDDEDVAELIVAGFSASGVRVDRAPTRERAIERCLSAAPDLIILDLKLPDGDGFSFVEWLRVQPGLGALPLVVYSGHEVSEAEMLELQLGPTQFLSKARVSPAEVEHLVLAMMLQVRQHQPAEAS